jgi:alpha-galactosidase
MKHKHTCSASLLFGFLRTCLALLLLALPGQLHADYTTQINPSENRGTRDGWGCSLAWWANVFGTRDDLADILFTTKDTAVTTNTASSNGQILPGLGMNIARYNAGGCTDSEVEGRRMVASPNIPAFKQIEGFWRDWYSTDPTSASWRWSADATQRAMLLKARDRGANLFELFSNSPLWWMCDNFNPSGSSSGTTDNLQAWNHDEHAIYLSTVAKYATDNWGITFNSVAPFNEPIAGWWRADGTQEGCYFSTSTQATVIGNLRRELNNRALQTSLVAASDESKYDMALDTWNAFNATTRAQIGQVNVHGYQYGGGRRDLLRSAVGNQRLWNSEYGEADSTGMELVSNLNLDFEYLRPTAWCYWQPLDSGGWGLIRSNPGDNWIGEVNPKYFVLAQYSRHIRPGMTIINGGSRDTIAAYDQLGKKLVIVTTNYGTAQSITHDLSAFSFLGGPIRRWITQTGAGDKYALRTDLSLSGKSLTAFFPANTVQTFEIPVAYQTATPLTPSPTTYEAESGIRNGSTNLENNNQYVGNLGNGIDNWVEIRSVSVSVGGTYRVTVSYASGDDSRALTLRMNGNDATRITQNVPNTGGWNTTATITYDIVLQAGINIIRFYNANTSGNTYAPPVDKISIPASPMPSITATGSLVAVNTTFPNSSPTPTGFTFSGTAMAAGILVTPPAGFEVSTASSGPYSSTLTLGVAGTIPSTQIFVRLAANTPTGTYGGNVVLSSFGATSVNVATVSSTVGGPVISAGSGNLNSVSATHPNASTAVRTFTVSGSSMTAGITATAPTGFEVSVPGNSYAPSVTFGEAGTINDTTISVRLAANTPAGDYSGNITLSSPGAVSQTRAIASSTVTGGPNISAGSGTLSARSATFPAVSTRTSFNVSGSSMTAAITVTAPAGFQVSTSTTSSTFQSSITTGQAGPISERAVYVRLAPNTPPGSFSGNVTLSSPGALQRTRAISGTVNPSSASITLSGTLLPFNTSFGSASDVQTFTVSGTSMAAAITVAAPAGFEVSVNGGAYASSITISPVSGAITPTTVSVRLATNAFSGTYSGTITANSTGAAQQTLSIPTGTVAASSPISYSLSGTVVSAGNSLPGVLLTLTGDTTSSVVSDRNGNYLLAGLPNGTYTVTPSKPGHVFQPSSKTVTIADANQTAQDFSHSYDPATTVTVPFGTGNSIVYNRSSKSYDVFYGTTRIITQALAKAKNANVMLNSSDYSTATVTNASHTDGIGSGTTYTVTLTGTGLPQMQQMFYVYDTAGYFFTEVSIQGTGLSSNYMAPLATNAVSLPVAGEYRSLFVPFDNDTFVRYDAKPLAESVTSSEVGAIYENTSRTGIVAGSVQSDHWKTGVKAVGTGTQLSELTVWGGYADAGVTRDQRVHGSLVGSSIKSPRMFVGCFSDFRDGMDLYGKAVNVFNPRYIYNFTGSAPFAYNTWGDIQSDLTLTKAKAVADFVHTQIPAFRSDNKVYIDLDSYWDNLVTGGLTGDFSQLTEFVNYCKARGLQPGIYWAPFVDWGKTERSVEGAPAYNYRDIWTKLNGGFHELNGTRALDPTHPGTKLRINLVIDKFKACGFEFIKLDFIGHAAVEADSWHDTSVKTGYQAFNQGMKHLTDRLGDQMLVYAAISPNIATGPYAHIRRLACDAFAQINDTEYTMNSVSYGWWQSQIYNYIDADHIVFGSRYEASSTEGENRARFASALTCGPIVLGDDFSNPDVYSNRIKDYAQREVLLDIGRKGGKAFRPVETNSGSAAVDAYSSQVGNDLYVVVFNYSASSKSYNIALDRLGLSGSYTAKELFSLTDVSINGALSTSVAAKDAKIFRIPTIASITTAPTASAITYGQTLASSTLSRGTGSVSGTFAFTSPTTLPDTGTSDHSVTFTPSLASNLRGATTMVSVTVNKAASTIVSLPTASAITVGETLASSALTGGSASTPGTFRFTTPSTSPSAGTSNQSVTFTPTDSNNYNTTTGTVSVVVNPVEVPPAPEISASGTFSAFSTTYANASSAQTFTVSGVDLSTGITAAAPAGFEVSADGLSYATSITFGTAGTIVPTTISVRLEASSPAGSYSGNITLNSNGAPQQILSISSGTVAAKSLTVTGLTGTNKIYNGNSNATASGAAALTGVVGADDVSLAGTPVYTFDSADVGTAVAITTTGYTLAGANAGNYTLTQPGLSATIFEDPLFADPENFPRIALLPGGVARLAFRGIPGRTYAIQRSTTMLPGSWTQISTVTVGENSQVTFDDLDAPARSAFYRVGLPGEVTSVLEGIF